MIKFLCSQIFRLQGWTYVNHISQDLTSFVMLGAPHTSNWDFIPAMTVAHRLGKTAKFVIKKEWLKFPAGLVLKPMGAIGVDREKIKSGLVSSSTDQMAQLFKQHVPLVMMIAPEGTRSANDEWKSGFWYVAQKAQVPVVLAFADYATKTAGLARVIYPSDFEKDMREIMAFYRTITPARPHKFKLDKRFLS